jgi:hypothetical protein
MLAPPNCYLRKCVHYLGVVQPDGTELTERPNCRAFPQGIPEEIAYGPNLHLTPLPDQGNSIVYERRTK